MTCVAAFLHTGADDPRRQQQHSHESRAPAMAHLERGSGSAGFPHRQHLHARSSLLLVRFEDLAGGAWHAGNTLAQSPSGVPSERQLHAYVRGWIGYVVRTDSGQSGSGQHAGAADGGTERQIAGNQFVPESEIDRPS